jgi:hypothetical protein
MLSKSDKSYRHFKLTQLNCKTEYLKLYQHFRYFYYFAESLMFTELDPLGSYTKHSDVCMHKQHAMHIKPCTLA